MAGVGLIVGIAMTSTSCFLGEEPPPRPVSNWTVEDARGFNEFPLYWLGEGYEGLPLTSMRGSTDGDGVRHVNFSYGEPTLAGSALSQSWLPPLEVDIQPYCGFSPEEFLSHEESYSADVRNVEIRGVSGYLRLYSSQEADLSLWAGGSAIHVSTWKSEFDVEDVADDLIPIAEETNALLQPFPQPTATSC